MKISGGNVSGAFYRDVRAARQKRDSDAQGPKPYVVYTLKKDGSRRAKPHTDLRGNEQAFATPEEAHAERVRMKGLNPHLEFEVVNRLTGQKVPPPSGGGGHGGGNPNHDEKGRFTDGPSGG